LFGCASLGLNYASERPELAEYLRKEQKIGIFTEIERKRL
jgi:hypothetical protein